MFCSSLEYFPLGSSALKIRKVPKMVSLSALQAIQSKNFKVIDIRRLYNLIRKFPPYVHISFVWIPAHVGIQGNENVDKLAKAALNRTSTSGKLICYSDLKSKINTYIKSVWQRDWEAEGANKLHEMLPNLGEDLHRRGKGAGRKLETAMCRLWVGHTWLTQSYLLKNEQQPFCYARDSLYTVWHILIECPDFQDTRRKCFSVTDMYRLFREVNPSRIVGIWGSAFCIQFKRLFQDDKNVDTVELMRREREELQEELQKDLAKYDAEDSESSDDDDTSKKEKGTHGEKTTGGLQRKRSKSTKLKQKSFWDGIVARMMESSWFQSIEVRAAQVFNFMRGLSLNNVYPFSPFTKTQEEEDENNKGTFGSIFDLHPTSVKKLYVVDSGLTFNSPYPVVLRPQREVDIILSFDFSARPSDDTPPFKELLLAAKWAELNKVPFPPIDPHIIEKEGLKECYVFKHPWDPNCPIVLHFCLINVNFRRETSPGVLRTTQEEIDFGNFSIFDDPAHPYSTFKFTYTHQEFERLSLLMEYNTLLCKDIIFDNISTCIKRRRRFSIRRPCTKKDIARLSLNSRSKVTELENYITMVEKVTEASQQEEAFSLTSLSSSTSSSSELNGKPLFTCGGSGGRRGSKEEADISLLMNKPRPISSPVRFIKELEQEQRMAIRQSDVSENVKDHQDPILNSRLQRSAISLKTNRSGRSRSRLSSAMSKVDEEVDEADEPDTSNDMPILSEKAAPSRGVLSRSRPVSASMKPLVNTERKTSSQEPDDASISVQDPSTSSNNNYEINALQLNSSGIQPLRSPRLAKRANALTPEQRKANGQASMEGPFFSNGQDSDGHLSSVTYSADKGDVNEGNIKALSRSAEIERLVDSLERVTDL
ncbi:cytosolic phospholipase a2 [Plakobranchus ocellatus]|uniref:Cytosolic phospholipase a2 n=1 Tax=Plakobranchus ocellatus TaxID=259542 RepID=A0AAV4DZG5_9GAST|nr:cytosolic phospholipase a2 [Plakobranchus ocellatus]